MVKNLPAVQETWVQSLSQEDPLEKGMATHASLLAWRIPCTEGGAWWFTPSPPPLPVRQDARDPRTSLPAGTGKVWDGTGPNGPAVQ